MSINELLKKNSGKIAVVSIAVANLACSWKDIKTTIFLGGGLLAVAVIYKIGHYLVNIPEIKGPLDERRLNIMFPIEKPIDESKQKSKSTPPAKVHNLNTNQKDELDIPYMQNATAHATLTQVKTKIINGKVFIRVPGNGYVEAGLYNQNEDSTKNNFLL